MTLAIFFYFRQYTGTITSVLSASGNSRTTHWVHTGSKINSNIICISDPCDMEMLVCS